MGDLKRRPESMRPICAVFTEQSWLEVAGLADQLVHTDIACNHYTASHMRYAVRLRAKVLFRDTRQLCFAILR